MTIGTSLDRHPSVGSSPAATLASAKRTLLSSFCVCCALQQFHAPRSSRSALAADGRGDLLPASWRQPLKLGETSVSVTSVNTSVNKVYTAEPRADPLPLVREAGTGIAKVPVCN